MIIQQGLDLIKKYEGLSLVPYLCSGKKPTIGYGATFYSNGADVKLSDPAITEAQADELLRFHVKHFEDGVLSLVKSRLDEYQKAALVSFAFNVGLEALNRSTLLAMINHNPTDIAIIREILRWDKSRGKPLLGLAKRRIAEAFLYFT